MSFLAGAATALAVGLAGFRWLRMAQAEHYLPGSAGLVASRWWSSMPANAALATLAVGALVLGPPGALFTLAVVALGPLGLPLLGRGRRLTPTRRLNVLASIWAVLCILAVFFLTAGAGLPLAMSGALVAVGVPLIVDAAMWLALPIEAWIGRRWAARASARLRQVAPLVVAITGSYGKTTTKGLVAHLLAPGRRVLATPASWNNRSGLARAVNEQLADGTEVFVAEMGTYGPGEIAEMVRWFPPHISVITAIGPVHLERFGSLERTLSSKSEILPGARDVVLNVDDERLAALADQLGHAGPAAAPAGPRVWRCSSVDLGADVGVVPGADGAVRVTVRGLRVADLPGLDIAPVNLACAIAASLAAGLSREDLARRLTEPVPVPDHRLSRSTGAKGFTILDDTFNANPAGAVRALDALRLAGGDRRVVVTPGMVELGPLQDEANQAFAAAAAEVATDLVVVGRTNRRALLRGAARGKVNTVTQPSRQAAVDWVKTNLGPGDTVLYENDLPDSYP